MAAGLRARRQGAGARGGGRFRVAARAAAPGRRECAGPRSVERRRRAARAAAQGLRAFFVDAVKRGEIASRLSSAAEALQQACDALAGSLAE